MKNIQLQPIAFVKNERKEAIDDGWGKIVSKLELAEQMKSDSLNGIEGFSHLEIIYYFHKTSKVVEGSEHPRGNIDWPSVGIFAQRKKDRPNHIGATIVKLVKKEGRSLIVSHLDAIDGTPILDIKPVLKEFLPQDTIVQPSWSKELMKNYWD